MLVSTFELWKFKQQKKSKLKRSKKNLKKKFEKSVRALLNCSLFNFAFKNKIHQ